MFFLYFKTNLTFKIYQGTNVIQNGRDNNREPSNKDGDSYAENIEQTQLPGNDEIQENPEIPDSQCLINDVNNFNPT